MGNKRRQAAAKAAQATSQQQENTSVDQPNQQSDSGENSAPADAPVPLGNDRAYGWVQIGEYEAQMGGIVAAALASSGLTVDQWNALTSEDRDARIDTRIEEERKALAAGDPVGVFLHKIPVDRAVGQDGSTGSSDPVDTTVDERQFASPTGLSAPQAGQMTDGSSSAGVSSGEITAAAPTAVSLGAPTGTPAAVNAAVEAAISAKLPVAAHDDLPAMPGGFSVTAQSALAAVIEYIPAMRPKMPVALSARLRNQTNLYRAITTVINKLDGEEFTRAWSWLLEQFSLYRDGVFSERHVYRDFDNLPLSEGDRRAFQRLLLLLKLTCDPKSRPTALKQIDITKTLALGVTEPGRQRLHAFYGV